MMFWSEEMESVWKRLEELFGKLIVRIVDFQNDWDRCDPIWRFCWQTRKGKWYEAKISHYNGVYFFVNCGERWYEDSWIWEVKPGEFCREYDSGAHERHPWPRVEDLEDMLAWLDRVEKDWMSVYRKVEKEWPNRRRNGSVSRAVVERYVKDFPRQGELAGKEIVEKFCAIVEGKYYEVQGRRRRGFIARR